MVEVFDPQIFLFNLVGMIGKIPVTLGLTLASTVLGFFFGLLDAIIIRYKVKILKPIVVGSISFLRGTPIILQMYVIYYLLPIFYDTLAEARGWNFRSNQIPISFMVILALSLNLSAYLAETIRSGLEAVSKGEIEAAYSLGMTEGMVFHRIIFPEAIRIFIPNFSSNLINCLHGTSLAFFLSLVEITGKANILAQYNWRYLEAFLGAGLLYWGITMGIEVLTHFAEKHLNKASA